VEIGILNTKIKLVSFALCPFVQRSVITLNYKKAKYDIEYIDLTAKPDWFLKLSPLGKVPIIQINNSDILFESTVINEYLDETIGEPTLSKDPLEKAKQRAWIEFSSILIGDFYKTIYSEDPISAADAYVEKILKLENIIDDSGFFKSQFSIVDSSYAPIFARIQYFSSIWDHEKFKGTKCKKWAQNLVQQQYVIDSVKPTFKDDMKESLKLKAPHAYDLMDR